MKILSHELKPLFVEAVKAAFPELDENEILEWVSLEDPRDISHGDYACPVAFKLAKILGKSPAQIGQAIVDNFPEDGRVGEVAFAAPGYVNLRLEVSFLSEMLKQLENGFSMESGLNVEAVGMRKRPLIVEYPSTNAAKPMGVHHIITTVLGDSIANILDFAGYEVIRINHLGDWGTHFGKIIYAVETWGDKTAIHMNPNEEFAKLYVKFNEEAEKNPDLNDEARAIFKSLEDGDELRIAMWEWILSESMVDLEKILKRMGIEVDHHMGESFYVKKAEDILKDGIEKGIFVEGEGGALIFDMGEDQTPALLRKSDGTTLYLTRDIATAKYRVETWHPESILYVVDHAQSLHFRQDEAVCKALGYLEDSRIEHISFGRMSFAGEAISTRKGNVIKLEDLLDEAANRAGKLAQDRGNDMPREEMEILMEVVGMSSLKYGILSQDRNKDIIFDWDKIITLEGNSAPYLMYTYARAGSILNKVGEIALSGLPKLTEELEIELIRLMIKFPRVIEQAAADRKPHQIAHFLYELCQTFNRFYGNVHVATASKEEQRTRVGLIQAFMYELKSGLSMLGIPVLDKM